MVMPVRCRAEQKVRELRRRLVHRTYVGRGLVSDGELVDLARAGEREALAELFERHRVGLYAAALAMLRDREKAMDAVQETFVVALARLDGLREPSAVGGWLHTVVRNCALMQLRLDRRELAIAALDRGAVVAGADRALDG